MMLNFRQNEIREVLRAIGLATGANIVADRDVDGPITCYLKNVSLETALEAVTIPNGFTWEHEGDLYRIRRIKDNPFIQARNGKLTVHSDNVAIGIFLDVLSKATGTNFVITDPVQVSITAHLTQVPIEDGVIQALRSNGLSVSKEGAIYRVAPAKPPVKVEKREDGTLVVDAQGADIRTVFSSIGRLMGENLVLDADVSVPNVTFYVTQAKFTDVLDAITATYGLGWQKLGNLYRIYRPQAGVQLPVAIDENKRVSFDLRGAELGEIVRQIATRMGWNIIFYSELREKVNQRIDKLPVAEALDRMFENTPYEWMLDQNSKPAPTLIIGNPASGTREAGLFLIETAYPIEFIKAGDAMGFLPRELPSSNIKILQEQNVLLLNGTSRMHRAMRNLLARIDTAPRQIKIDLIVVEVNREKARNLGLGAIAFQNDDIVGTVSPAGAPTASFSVAKGRNLSASLSTSLTALERQGVVKVKAQPSVLVKSGQTATIAVSREDNFQLIAPSATPNVPVIQIQKIPSGITMNITPWVGIEGDAVHLTISGEVSSASGQISGSQLPTVSARRANTQVVVLDGQTITIGGLIQGRDNEAEDRVPVLGELPILKYIFGNTSKSTSSTELIFYITPRIYSLGSEVMAATTDTGTVSVAGSAK